MKRLIDLVSKGSEKPEPTPSPDSLYADWEPTDARDTPPTPAVPWGHPDFARAWSDWWGAIDRRNRKYRQGIHATAHRDDVRSAKSPKPRIVNHP